MMKRGGGFGGMGGMQQLMQQAQQMQKKMEAVQEQLAQKTVEVAAGGGAVKVVMTGKQELVSLAIAPEALEGADAEMVSEMVAGAVREALKKSKEMQNDLLSAATGGLALPPGMF